MLDLKGYGASILDGTTINVACGLLALAVSVVIGIVMALAKLSRSGALRGIATVYTTLIRGVPDLVVMLLVFYGGQTFVNQVMTWLGSDEYVDINPFVAGVISIGFIYGAYMTETFRGAILAIPRGQMEAAWAFGMGRVRTFVRITAPQMVRYALPGFTNNWLVLIKATALVSLIGLHEMTYLAKQASAATREPFTFFLFAAALFLVYTTVSLWALRWVNRRFSLGVKRLTH
jgi:arginine/ornithine transport system permease protein